IRPVRHPRLSHARPDRDQAMTAERRRLDVVANHALDPRRGARSMGALRGVRPDLLGDGGRIVRVNPLPPVDLRFQLDEPPLRNLAVVEATAVALAAVDAVFDLPAFPLASSRRVAPSVPDVAHQPASFTYPRRRAVEIHRLAFARGMSYSRSSRPSGASPVARAQW